MLCIAALFLFGVTTANAQLKFGLKAGLSLANINYDGEDGDETEFLPTFHAGPIVEFGITESIGVGAGALLSGKGFQIKDEFLGEKFTSKANPLYLQIPVMLQYKNNGFFAAIGPYVAFGIGGKLKTEVAGETDSEPIDFGNSELDGFSPLDFGAGLELGYSFGPVRVSGSYNLGLANVIPKDYADASGEKATHTVIGVSAAYLFGK